MKYLTLLILITFNLFSSTKNLTDFRSYKVGKSKSQFTYILHYEKDRNVSGTSEQEVKLSKDKKTLVVNGQSKSKIGDFDFTFTVNLKDNTYTYKNKQNQNDKGTIKVVDDETLKMVSLKNKMYAIIKYSCGPTNESFRSETKYYSTQNQLVMTIKELNIANNNHQMNFDQSTPINALKYHMNSLRTRNKTAYTNSIYASDKFLKNHVINIEYAEAINQLNLILLKKYNNKRMLDAFYDDLLAINDLKNILKTVDCKIEGNDALVFSNDDPPSSLPFIKVKGIWKINYSLLESKS